MTITRILIVTMLALLLQYGVTNVQAEQVAIVHNSTQEIEACKGKLQLKWIRTWGGENEEDENKFFVYPSSIALDAQKNVYISDLYNACIQVYDFNGAYIRTIGQKGRGPTDLIGPRTLEFSPEGDLWVNELGNRRFQCFYTTGKSKTIFRYNGFPQWMGVTKRNEIAIYSHQQTFESKTLLSLHNSKGKWLRSIGEYHSTAPKSLGSETLCVAKDENDNFYAANMWTSIIRKYAYNGSLSMVLTFDTPFNVLPLAVRLNKKGNEIEPLDGPEANEYRIKKLANGGVIINNVAGKGKKWEKFPKFVAIGTDAKQNIYVVTSKRALTKKEASAINIFGDVSSFSTIIRTGTDFDAIENIDMYHLLVFNPSGKIIAEAPLTTLCDGIYINGNRLFILDGQVSQRILEYEMTFK